MQGNKGGPAIALALKAQLDHYLKNPSYVFSVPQEEEFQFELSRAKDYQVGVVEDFSYRDCVPPFVFQKFAKRTLRLKKWIKALRSADLIIDMSAISYIGPPIGTSLNVLLSTRVRYFLTARLLQRKLLAWTQSYGPLSTPLTRLLSKWDLGSQPAIFCRGEISRKNVSQLLPHKTSYSFPDVATILDFNKQWGADYIQYKFAADFDLSTLVTISPSAVIYKKTKDNNQTSTHVLNIMHICDFLAKKGYAILLVPHTFRPERHYPEICDYAVSQIIKVECKSEQFQGRLQVVADDLSPIELKSIISNAAVHIGARYHSLIASLSSGVPSISLSWHHKYLDLMTQYKMQEYIFNETDFTRPSQLVRMFNRIMNRREQIKAILEKEQKNIKLQVEDNTKLFVDLMNRRHL